MANDTIAREAGTLAGCLVEFQVAPRAELESRRRRDYQPLEVLLEFAVVPCRNLEIPLFLMARSNLIASLRLGHSWDQTSLQGPSNLLVVWVLRYEGSLCWRRG